MAESKGHGRGDEDEEDEEDDEIDETNYKTARDAVLFAIDISPSMLTKPEPSDDKKADRDSPAQAALKCAYQLMQQRIISNPKDMMGILLFGTEQSKFEGEDQNARGGLQYPHCYLLADLEVPAAVNVKRLRNLIEDEEESAKLLEPSATPVSMANVLFCANNLFTTKAPNFSSRRLFLVTDDDGPHSDDKALRSSAAVRAKDLYDLGVIIELFPIARPNHGFDRAKFYDDIVYQVTPTDPDAPAPLVSASKPVSGGDGISLLQSLLSSINSKATPRRAVFSLPFEIGPGLRISVKGYVVIKRQQPVRSCYVWLGGEKPQLAVGSSTKIADDTARTVEKAEIRKAFKFGGETVSFSKEELVKIRSFGDPVIRIIGFKPISMLPVWANVKTATFIYPSEEDFVGSIRVFSALQQKLLNDQKMAVAWFLARRNASPVLAAIFPGEERVGDDGEQKMPPGLWVVPLPFADDIRQNPETPLVPAPDAVVDKMRKVIQQLQLPKAQYDPSKYPNPSLQWFYRILQAVALEEDLPEQPEDKTIPRYKQIDKRAGPYVIEWGQELDAHFAAWQQSKGSKRPAEPASGAPPKKAKLASGAAASGTSEVVDDALMHQFFEKGTIGKLTVPVIKGWAAAKNIDVSGKKGDLVERVEGYFEHK